MKFSDYIKSLEEDGAAGGAGTMGGGGTVTTDIEIFPNKIPSSTGKQEKKTKKSNKKKVKDYTIIGDTTMERR